MPFIRGRYYANPVVGRAIEAAREAEEARALANSDSDGERASGAESGANDGKEQRLEDLDGTAPVRRIEIEVAEMVPAQSGRATKGYVARLHRGGTGEGSSAIFREPAEKRVFYDPGQLADFLKNELGNNGAR